MQSAIEPTSAIIWLAILAMATWGFSGVLQWQIIRHQEKILATLQQLQLQALSQVELGKAPRLNGTQIPGAPIKHMQAPLAG